MKRRFAVATMLGLVPALGLATTAGAASDEWCDIDPLVVIKTPRGNLVPVYTTNGAKGLEHQATLPLTKVSYSAQAADGGKTLVKMDVTVPNDLFGSGFATRTKISTGPMGTLDVLSTAEGTSGRVMRLQFTLDTP
ncbi:MAG TPA: hypothetical protein VFX49_11330 [Chloroflexota bacterium]|nr:hypothetical protein [Chloroflexota bacterium]